MAGGSLTAGNKQESIEAPAAGNNVTDDAVAQRMRELRGEA